MIILNVGKSKDLFSVNYIQCKKQNKLGCIIIWYFETKIKWINFVLVKKYYLKGEYRRWGEILPLHDINNNIIISQLACIPKWIRKMKYLPRYKYIFGVVSRKEFNETMVHIPIVLINI